MKKFKRSIAVFLAMAMTVLLLTAGFATAEEASESVTVIFENTVLSEEDADGEIWTGSYTKEVKLQEGMKMSDAVVAAAKDQFGEDGITVDNSWGFFITAIGGLSSTSVKNAPAGAYPGFTGTLNDWFVDQTFDNFTVDAGDVIKVMFTIIAIQALIVNCALIPLAPFKFIGNMFSCVPFGITGWCVVIVLALTMIPVDLIRKAVIGAGKEEKASVEETEE